MQTAMDEVTKAEAPVMPGSTPQDLAEENIPHLRPAVTAPKRTLLVSSGKWDISAPHGTPDVIPASRSKPSQPPETAMTSEISLLEAIMLESEETSKGAVADAENHDRPSSQRKQSSPIHRRTLGTAKNSLLSQTRACESGLSSGLAQQPVGDQTGADVLGDGQAHSTALDDPDSQAEVIYRGPLAGPAQHDPAAPLLRQKKSSTFMSRRAMSTIERQIARDARYKADTHDADDEDEGGSEDDNTRMDQSSRPGVPPAQVLINESDTSEGRLDKEYGTRFKTPKRRPPRQESEYAPVRPRPKRQKILQESSMASDIIPITKTRTKTWSRVLRPRQNAGNGVPLPIQHERNNALDSDKQRTDIENVRTDHPPTRPFEQVQIDSCPPWSFHRSPVVPSDSEDEQDIDPCPAWMETAKQADTDAGDHERPNGQHPKQHKPPQTSEVVPEKQDIVAIQRGASAQSPPDTIRVRQDSHSEDEYGGWDGDGGVHGMWSWPDPYA
ncbi:hypothetical protein KVT40_004021 [Elsinoe batatas]|uniref:Uncharacterized protein n=1 Tax=Elsinoe batatas TaxID=2601811 RepID=A0A8K0L9G4_9PEZI|nr:hypothetical protein KVT40_004021 [Elsinoe batatas]